ncbi:MAG: Ribonuclease BN [Candidatus Anoxychlamydiales bacterium]|nr:Ribonuclease BN [Candidatus Anoxychlamydiales bacterium]
MSKVTFLGTGASTAVPVINCRCTTCRSDSRYNKRLRPSVLIEKNRKKILIDVGPDIRMQAVRYKIKKIDVLILTHAHFDHIAGLDDLRIFNRIQEKPIRCYLLKETFKEIKIKFDHFFKRNLKHHTQGAKFDFHVLDGKKQNFRFEDMSFEYFSYFQDSKKVLGVRVDDFAYITDIKRYDEKIFKKLMNLDVLVLSALRHQKSDVHFNIKEAIEFIKIVKPKKAYLTHLGHEIEYLRDSKKLLKNVFLAYDGLEIKF